MKKQKGISLIVLIITIIIIIILATVIMVTTLKNNPIENAKEARFKSMLSRLEEELVLFETKEYARSLGVYQNETLNADKGILSYNTKEGVSGNIKDILPNLEKKYEENIIIVNGKICLKSQNKNELTWALEMGINIDPYKIENGVLLSSDTNLMLMDSNGKLVIPGTVEEIGAGAFSNVSGLKEIVIPGNVKVIGSNAFSYNDTLEKVIIEDGVLTIKTNAFSHCNCLKEVKMSDTVTQLGVQAFIGDSKLIHINLSNGITEIKNYLFSGCVSLETIDIPEGVTKIYENAFSNCKNLKKITIPSSVTSIDPSAFNGLKEVNIVIDSNNEYFEYENNILFEKSSSNMLYVLESAIDGDTFRIPDRVVNFNAILFKPYQQINKIIITANVRDMGEYLYELKNLKEIEIEKNDYFVVKDDVLYNSDKSHLIYSFNQEKEFIIPLEVSVIKEGAFKNCKKLEKLTISDNVTTIQLHAFAGLLNLKSLEIGSRVSKLNPLFMIGSNNCTVTIKPDNQNYIIIDNIIYSKNQKKVICMVGDFEEVHFIDGVEEIGADAFRSRTKIKNIILPNTVKSIKTHAFSYSNNLESIFIPSSVTSISGSFIGCTKLRQITIDKEKGSISGAPWGCIYGDRAIFWKK